MERKGEISCEQGENDKPAGIDAYRDAQQTEQLPAFLEHRIRPFEMAGEDSRSHIFVANVVPEQFVGHAASVPVGRKLCALRIFPAGHAKEGDSAPGQEGEQPSKKESDRRAAGIE